MRRTRNKGQASLMYLGLVIFLFLSWGIINEYIKVIKTKLTVSKHDEGRVPFLEKDKNAGGSVTYVNLNANALGIYDAFYNYMFGMQEDEETAMELLLQTPTHRVKEMALIYATIQGKGKNMYSDFRKYLTATEYKKVSHKLT